ncbi:glucosamine kinase [Pseudochelatococcus lubricantis]|uniref:Glucosamine kinase n=1 Tax=Pseudochelatococcus lubricantis TaxID=1538102 RepID=A0ABX0V1V1_9HYPH|nr:BadF/BadG/BcrA/BcrD ATPase family protein [Pseudochelatococcus lubricantis]NIJ58089.1 glucosamine kinase [Pseudochelatococcus lubricantis]
MEQPLFLGIDGGGTRCRARLCDADGRTLGEGMGGAANIRLAPEGVRDAILTAATEARERAGLDAAAWRRTHAGFGLAGAGQTSARERIMRQPFPFASIALDTDARAAWLGATAKAAEGDRGAILIVGTGVCGYVEKGEGPERRRISIGGWGFPLSDDGSGAVTGREAIRRTLHVCDGLAPPGSLSDAILADIGPTPEAIIDWGDRATPADYARFAPVVYAHAARGDALARAVATEAALAIGRLTLRLVELGAPRVHLIGGLTDTVRPWLADAVRHHFAPPDADALAGAVAMARENCPGQPGKAAP